MNLEYRKLTHPARQAFSRDKSRRILGLRTLTLGNGVVAFRQHLARTSREFSGKTEGHRRGTGLANSPVSLFLSYLPEIRPVLRSLVIIAAVAAISIGLSQLENAHSQMPTASPAWVRTIDGWEPSSVLTADPLSTPPALHPFLVAGFELGASLFVLLAFPYRKSR